MERLKRHLLFVGAFPPPDKKIFGGNITDCRALLDAGLGTCLNLTLLDSTQQSIPPGPFVQRLLSSLSRMGKYLSLVARRKPDAILIFTSSGLSFLEKSLMAVFGRLTKTQVLLFPRGGRLIDDSRRSFTYRQYVRFMLKFPDVILCQGEVWRKFYTEELGINADKCVVLPSWTATPSLLKIGAGRTYDDNTRLRILFLGWLNQSKGIFELIDAVEQLRSSFPHLELLIAGEGELSTEARRTVTQKALEEVVRFLGWIDGEEKQKAFSQSTVFCLPSHVEGLPNAMIEAMACGLPVVVTPVGSIPDVIHDGQNGLLTPIQDSDALAQRLQVLLADPALREQIGRAAYETAASEFVAEKAVQHLVSLIEEGTGERGSL